MANETTITARMQVSGLDQLEKANALMEKLKASTASLGSSGGPSSGFTSKLNADVEKATINVKKLSEVVKTVGSAPSQSSAFSSMSEGINRSVAGGEKLTIALKESVAQSERLVSANERIAASQNKGATEAEKMASAQARFANEQSRVSQETSRFSEASAKSETSWGKISGALKDSFAMFSVGMLGMNAVNGAVEGVKSIVKGGWDTVKEQQSGQAMWATSIQDAHPDISGKELTTQSKAANDALMSTAIKAGNDFSEANAIAKQVYSSDGGVYSGDLGKTRQVVTSMFNIQDANSLTSREMEQFRTAVGNIGDTGKMSGNAAKSLNLLDGKITRKIREEYKNRTGHELEKNKKGGFEWGNIDAETAFAGIDGYGNSGAMAKASERTNSTIGGVLRAGDSGLKSMAANFITTFSNNIAKSFGGKGGLFERLSGFFTDQGKLNKISTSMANSTSKVADVIGKVGREAASVGKDLSPYTNSFTKGFGKGFVDEVKVVAKGTKDAYEGIKGLGSKIGKALPDGKIKDKLGDIGQATGKISAFFLAIRGFSKLPGMSGVAQKTIGPLVKVLDRIPVVGKSLSGIVKTLTGVKPKENTAASKMMSAADKMNVAAEKMNGGVSGKYKAGLDENGLVTSDYSTRSEYQAALKGEAKVRRGTKWIQKGESLLGMPGGRVAENSSWMQKLRGKSLVKFGSMSNKIGESLIGRATGGLFKGIGATGKFIGKGMPLMNAAFAGIDTMSAMNSTKSGSLARHQKVGSAVGTGVGSTLGMALGTLADPFTFGMGTLAGGALGGWLGGKAGKWLGSNFGGTKPKSKKKGKSALEMQQKAEQNQSLNESAQAIVSGGGAKDIKTAKSGLKSISAAQGTKSKSAQKYAAQASSALQNNDFAGYSKATASAAKATAKYYASNASKANKKAESDKDALSKAKKVAAQAKKAGTGFGASSAGIQAYTKALRDVDKAQSKYNKSKKKATNANKKAKSTNKDSKALGNKSVTAEKKHKKAVQETEKASSKANKKMSKSAEKSNKKISKSTERTNKTASKSFSKLTKSQKKELDKQVKALKTANNKKTAQVKSANKKVKSAQQKAAKDIAKADKAASKAMSKNYKTASQQISKAVKSGMKKATNEAKKGAKNFAKAIKSGMKNIDKPVKTAFKSLSKSVKSGMKPAESSAKSGAKKIVSNTKSGLSKLGSAGKSGFSKLDSATKSGMNKVASSVKSGANKAVSNFKSSFNKLSSVANAATSKVAKSMNKIGSSATAASSKVKALQSAINGLKSKTVTITANVKGKGSDKLATGTPGSTSAFAHLATGTPSFDAPTHLAQGWAANGGVKSGMYVVNDAKGGRWREAFKLKNGLVGLFPNKRDLRVPLEEGTQVLNGDDTHHMFPHLETGTPGAKGAMSGGTKAGKAGSPIINITINMNGGGVKNDAQAIANTIGEKLRAIFPTLEV